MSSAKLDILLVEDNPGDARLIREMLQEAEGVDFAIDWVPRLSEALEKLGRGEPDLVLLDLGLPDSRGLETFVRAYAHAPQVPFVVLSGLDDETLALSAVREGAQDYLVKGQTDSGMLLRAIRYATERKRIEEELRLANEELESRVAARTEELRRTNEELRQEITQRQQAERALQLTHDTLELKVAIRTAELAKANMDMLQENKTRRAAEMAVEAERQRLYALLDGLPGLVYLKAPDYSLKFANRLFRETCGDWEGKKCYEAIFKTETPCENCTQFRILETGEPSVKEASYAESNRTYQVYSYPFADVDGTSLVLTLGIDITKSKEAEEALRRSQARLAKAQRLAHLGNWELDLQSGEVIWSGEVYRIFGLTPELFTPSLEALMAYVHPEDEARVRKGLEETMAGVKPCNLVSRLIRPDGSIRYVHCQAEAVFDAGGKPRRLLGTAQDITDRRTAEMRLRESEERFRAIFDSAALGIALTDLEGRFLTANAVLLQMLGYQREELQNKSFLDITHPEDRELNGQLFQDLKTLKRDQYRLEKRYLRRDGSVLWVRATASPVWGMGGKPRYIVGLVEDITERKATEEKLRESETNLRHLASQLMRAQEDERKRISQELHDELGQALLVLKLQTRSVERELQPEQESLRAECLEILTNIDQVVNNVRRLAHDLSPIMLEDLGLSVALERLIRDFSKHNNIEYYFQEANLNDLFPLATQTAIYRIFQESLTNIGKHAQATRLTVSIIRTGDRVAFLIQDNGKGFDPVQKRRQASGMGLASMEERVQMLGGTLSIWSQEGEGAKISFDIPYTTWQQ